MKSLKQFLSIALITGLLACFVIRPALAGTLLMRVADIYSGPSGSSPQYLTVYSGALYFTAFGNDGTGWQLWKYDSATNTPSRVTDFFYLSPTYLTVYNGALYFSANGNDGAGQQLWKYDNTTDTASRVTNIFSAVFPPERNPRNLAVYNGVLYFTANGNDGAGFELWKYDGATNAVSRVTNLYNGPGPNFLTVYNGVLYFSALGNDGAGFELWKYDSATNTASRAVDIASGPLGSSPQNLTIYNGALYFSADGQDGEGTELWKYDSVTNTASRITNIFDLWSNAPKFLAVYNGSIYFQANGNDGAGHELWKYDGVTNTASRVADIASGPTGSSPAFLATYNGALYFVADGNDGAGRELWKFIDDNIPPSSTPTSNPPSNTSTSNTPASSLPKTGFAPNRITSLAPQPANLTYAKLGDIWLEIPALHVKSNIVGVPQVNNNWDVTWLGNEAGWLNGTAFPSWKGNSVLTAHVYNSNGLPGPFARIKDLKYGDQVIVHLSRQKYIFKIQDTLLVRPSDTQVAFEHLEDQAYLTLITCQGYNKKTDSYLYRRIVRAVLVSIQDK